MDIEKRHMKQTDIESEGIGNAISESGIELTQCPTDEDFFTAKLLGLPFILRDDISNIVRYRLIDINKPFKYQFNCNYIHMWNVQFINGVEMRWHGWEIITSLSVSNRLIQKHHPELWDILNLPSDLNERDWFTTWRNLGS